MANDEEQIKATVGLAATAAVLLNQLLNNPESAQVFDMARNASTTQATALYRYVQSEDGKIHLKMMKDCIDQILDS